MRSLLSVIAMSYYQGRLIWELLLTAENETELDSRL